MSFSKIDAKPLDVRETLAKFAAQFTSILLDVLQDKNVCEQIYGLSIPILLKKIDVQNDDIQYLNTRVDKLEAALVDVNKRRLRKFQRETDLSKTFKGHEDDMTVSLTTNNLISKASLAESTNVPAVKTITKTIQRSPKPKVLKLANGEARGPLHRSRSFIKYSLHGCKSFTYEDLSLRCSKLSLRAQELFRANRNLLSLKRRQSLQISWTTPNMHELFSQVLTHKDLSKAGELFSLDDKAIEKDLTEVLDKIRGIVNTKDYESCNNDQSVVEICIQRVTTAIRETDSIERHFPALVSLLDVCLKYNLKPSSKDEDPPHSKIASDIMSCLFIHYYKQSVMENALPTVVHFLNSQNKELCRNVSSYLSLVAIDSAALLSKHSELIVNSVLQGNHSLTCVLPQIFTQNKQPILDYSSDLISLLEKCDVSEKTSLLQLLGMIAKSCPKLLEPYVFKFSEYLSSTVLAPFVLLMFVDMATINPQPFVTMATELKLLAEKQPVYCLQVVQIIAALSTVSKTEAHSSMAYLVCQMLTAEQAQMLVILQEIRRIGQRHRNLLAENISEISKLSENSTGAIQTLTLQLKDDNRKYSGEKEMRSVSSQTEGTVTVITVGNPPNAAYPSGTVAVKLSSSAVSSQQSLAKSSKASSSNARLVLNQSSSPASTLVSDHASVNSGVTVGSNTVTTPHGQNEPVRDAMLTFCEKRLSTIKSFISNLSADIPLPAKCRVVNGKHHRYVKLYFLCACHGSQCLYNQNYFTLDTRVPKTWIHLMFLAIQSCSSSALSQVDASVSSLRNCWEALKSVRGNGSFLTLVTSSFPTTKDQESLLHELYSARYFDVFEFNEVKKHWACFMCNHPEKVSTLLPDGVPAISDQLKEKKGKWKFLKRWKTRNFTLSGANITYNKSNDRQETLPISMIQSVKAVRKGIRDIPKAFEIFTANQTYVFKAKDRTRVEQWVQCIHIAVARSQKDDAEKTMTAKTSRPKSMIHDTKL